MKDHTPIKRHQALVTFSKDHHPGLLLVWKISQRPEKAIRAERINKYVVSFFKEDIKKHFKDEEQLLFCRLPVHGSFRKRTEEEQKFPKIFDTVFPGASVLKILLYILPAHFKKFYFPNHF